MQLADQPVVAGAQFFQAVACRLDIANTDISSIFGCAVTSGNSFSIIHPISINALMPLNMKFGLSFDKKSVKSGFLLSLLSLAPMLASIDDSFWLTHWDC